MGFNLQSLVQARDQTFVIWRNWKFGSTWTVVIKGTDFTEIFTAVAVDAHASGFEQRVLESCFA